MVLACAAAVQPSAAVGRRSGDGQRRWCSASGWKAVRPT